MTINNNMGLTVLGLFIHNIICLLQVWPSSSRFAFEFQLLRVDVLNENCDDFTVGHEARGRCEPFLGDFCLREGRNTQLVTPGGRDDCPLGYVPESGRVFAFTPNDLSRESETRPGLPDGPVNRTVMSEEPWPVRLNPRHEINKFIIILSLTLIAGDVSVVHSSQRA